MQPWIKNICMIWGAESRRITFGAKLVGMSPDGAVWHFDGLPTRSQTAKLWKEQEGAVYKAVNQHFEEVRSEEGLIVRRAYATMRERERRVMVGRFVALAHWKVACDVLKLSKDSYFNSLQICEGVIDAQSVTTEIREQITGKIRDYARG